MVASRDGIGDGDRMERERGMTEKTRKRAKTEGKGMVPIVHPSVVVKKTAPGPAPKEVAPADWSRVLDAAAIGIPADRLCHIAGMTDKTFSKYLARHPDRKEEIDASRTRGEYDMSRVVREAGVGWQGSAWLLERTRGYVARASIDHTSKGKELSISGNLLGAFGGK